MRIGITLPLQDDDTPDGHTPTFAETLAFARQAESTGLDTIWVYDHLLFRFPGQPEGAIRESWTTLTALAALVPRVELGTLVMCASFRNPALMAKMAATLDDLSGGRLILGLGSGWHDPEYAAFGYPTDHRTDRFGEDLEITVRMLRGERVTLAGRWRRVEDAVLAPPPGRRVPVLVAARRERMLRLTAAWADAWNTAWFGAADDRLRSHLDALRGACDAADRDPATMRRTVGLRLHEPDARIDDPTGIAADVDQLAKLFDDLAALGIDDAIVWAISKSPEAIDRVAAGRRRHLGEGG
jgi:alkanesulfonate monooxygenase SsuD/methylene tetrahydromethanopterin reductase-like flavin-dependent oxidoreductase (luciferase family)